MHTRVSSLSVQVQVTLNNNDLQADFTVQVANLHNGNYSTSGSIFLIEIVHLPLVFLPDLQTNLTP